MTSKEMAQKVISGLPEEATFDDIQYHLYVLECIERGEKEIEEGKVLTENEVRQRIVGIVHARRNIDPDQID
jgi:predicted transcriptional regulator